MEAKERRRKQTEERNQARKAGDKQMARVRALGRYKKRLRLSDASKLLQWSDTEIMKWGQESERAARQWSRRLSKSEAFQVQKEVARCTEKELSSGGDAKSSSRQLKITDWLVKGGAGAATGIG